MLHLIYDDNNRIVEVYFICHWKSQTQIAEKSNRYSIDWASG